MSFPLRFRVKAGGAQVIYFAISERSLGDGFGLRFVFVYAGGAADTVAFGGKILRFAPRIPEDCQPLRARILASPGRAKPSAAPARENPAPDDGRSLQFGRGRSRLGHHRLRLIGIRLFPLASYPWRSPR